MPIKNLSDRRRFPRAGLIKLGIMKKHPKSGNMYPEETDHFVCPDIVKKIYGEEPKELLVMFPVENEQIFFQQFYKRYGNGILLCKGDGDKADCWDFDEGGTKKIDCPCERLDKGDCKPVGMLQFLLPEVEESAGVWQINTSSKNSIIDINSGIDFVRGIAGRAAMIPIVLKREPLEIHRIEGKQLKKGTHYTLKLSLWGSLKQLQQHGQIPPERILLPEPDDSQPEDLFPKNGFKADQEKEETEHVLEEPEKPDEIEPESEFEEEARINDMKEELFGLKAQYEFMGGKVNQATEKRLNELNEKGTVETIQIAIDHFKREKAKLEKEK